MKYNVLVIAGTTESRQVIEKLLGENPNERILASVATELGKEMLLEYDIDVHVGRLDQDGFLALLKENPCEKIIDASHPFAKIVSETVKRWQSQQIFRMSDMREQTSNMIMKALFM